MTNHSNSLKIVLTGDAGIGKKSLLIRQTQYIFAKSSEGNVGTDFKVKLYKFDGVEIKVQIWDGIQRAFEKLQSMRKRYYQDAHVVGFCFSLNQPQTLFNLQQRLQMVKIINPSAKLFLVGCKSDIDISISEEEALKFAQIHELRYVRTSAKENVGVTQAFNLMVNQGFHLKFKKDNILTQAQKSLSDKNWHCQIM